MHDQWNVSIGCFSQQQPDIVLLNLLMPRLDGFAVIGHLRQDPDSRELPVIVLTAKTLTAAEHTILDQSVHTVLQKRGLERFPVVRATPHSTRNLMLCSLAHKRSSSKWEPL